MFVITSYSAFRSTHRPVWAEAVTAAQEYVALGGGLAATIQGVGSHWAVYANGDVELIEGPGHREDGTCPVCHDDLAFCPKATA